MSLNLATGHQPPPQFSPFICTNLNPGGIAKFASFTVREKPPICVFVSINTLDVGCAAAVAGAGSARGGSAFFFPQPPKPNPFSLLLIADEADCFATSPALGIAGPVGGGGKGASEAAGNGVLSVVIPIRITCKTGVPFNLDISSVISAIPLPAPWYWASMAGLIALLNTVPIFTANFR